MAVLESSSSRPAGRETWGGHGVVARGPSIHVHRQVNVETELRLKISSLQP